MRKQIGLSYIPSLSHALKPAIPVLFFLSSISTYAEVSYSTPLNGQELEIGNILEWTTDIENNSKFFVVQRSFDGISYENIGKVDAAGISEKSKDYRFMDIGMIDPKAYYRLKQIDTDGTSNFSQIVVIHKEMSNNFMVMAMSNPEARDRFEVVLDVIKDGDISYQLYRLDGEKLTDVTRSVSEGLNNIVFNLEDEPEGVYRVKMQFAKEEEELIIHKFEDELIKKPNVASKNKSIGG